MKKINFKMTGLVLALSALGAAPASQAATATQPDWVVSAAQDCRNLGGTSIGSSGVNEHYFFGDYGTNAAGATPVTVVCPLVRQTQELLGAWVYVEVDSGDNPDDDSTGKKVACSLHSTDWDGTELGSTTPTNPESATGKSFILLKVEGGTIPPSSTEWSHYSVKCTLPGNIQATANPATRSKIYNIALGENP